MKFIVFSDLHIHNYKKFDQGGSRLRNCASVLLKIYSEARKRGITHILFAGDLFDQQKSLPIPVINKTVKIFNYLEINYPEIEFIAISGNHDHGSKNTLENEAHTSLTFLDIMFKNFNLIDGTYFELDEKNNIWGIPYFSHPEHLEKFEKDFKFSDRCNNFLMIHQTPQHSNPMIPFDCRAQDFKRYEFTFCGHIHKHERLTRNFCIVGSPLHRDLGDEGQDKGFLVFDTDKNDYERVLLDFPKFIRTNNEEAAEGQYAVPVVELPKIDKANLEIPLDASYEAIVDAYTGKLGKEDIFSIIGKNLLK